MSKRWAAGLAAIAMSGGCAWILQERATDKAKAGKEPVECSTSLIPRGLDIAFAIADVVAAGVLIGHYSRTAEHTSMAIGAGVEGTLHVGSFFYGNDKADECRHYKEMK